MLLYFDNEVRSLVSHAVTFFSLSSSDWEDAVGQDGEGGGGLGGGHHAAALQAADEAGVHADDEQSDWPGAADDDDTVSVPG